MTSDQQGQISHKALKKKDDFIRNSLIIIKKMLELEPDCNQFPNQTNQPIGTMLVDEVLHSIFFLGAFNKPPCSPQEILAKDFMKLKTRFPNPFNLYSSQIPKRCPISCLLEMIVKFLGEENEGRIKQEMQKIINELKESLHEKILTSSTICVSQKSNSPNSVRYYGVSMSTSGPNPGKIMVMASCLVTWDRYVADAVMTCILEKLEDTKSKRSYSDGTIKFPSVRCQAYNISKGNELSPCDSCGKLFHLDNPGNEKWPYGHCAEAESLSNLLKYEEDFKREVQKSPTHTPSDSERAKTDVMELLRDLLNKSKFRWDNEFYTPQH